MRYFSKAMLVASAALCLNLSAYSQDISLKINNVTVKEAMERVKKDTGYSFVFSSKDVNTSQRVSVSVSDATIEEVIKQILKGQQGLDYEIQGKKIVLRKAQPVSNNENQEKKTVSGKVIDANGEPVIGATIMEKGTTNGTITDFDGNFNLNVVDGAQLEVSYVGFQSQNVKAIYGKNIAVTLKEDSELLDEVVVVGYGVQKKVNLTGAVSSVKGDDIELRPVVDATQSLQGMVPGLTITNSDTGRPGATGSLSLRGQGNLSGSAKPYILVDGVEMSLSDVNPSDIESISVLKDAAACSIYGARAAYGVILVTTKKGEEGKMRVNYQGSVGWTAPTVLPEMLDSYQFALMWNEASVNAGFSGLYDDEKLEMLKNFINDPNSVDPWFELDPNDSMNPAFENSVNGVGNTDYFKLHYKNWAFKQNHNISMSGGGKLAQFYISGGYYNEDGILRYADMDYSRYNISANVSSKVTNWLKVKLNTKFKHSVTNSPFGDGGLSEGFYHSLARFRPTIHYIDPNGHFTELSMIPYLQSGTYTTNVANNVNLTTGLEVNPIKNWFIFLDYTYKLSNSEYEALNVAPMIYAADGISLSKGVRGELGIIPDGKFTRSYSNSAYQTINLYSNYIFSLNEKHNFTLMAGYQEENYDYSYMKNAITGLYSSTNPNVGMGSGDRTIVDTRRGWATRGFFGRINYDYDGKYLLEVNGRYDGSSRFASKNRWGFFPSVSVGWNIYREHFMESSSNFLSNLKLRGSYGLLGNQAGAGLYTFASTMSLSDDLGKFIFDDGRHIYTKAPGVINPNTTWEKVKSVNLGLDFGFWNNALIGTFEIYQRDTKDMLGPGLDFPDYFGAAAPQTNNACLRDRGWELSLNYRGKIGKDIQYSIGGLISDAVSEVTDYANPTFTNPSGNWYIGKKVGEIWGYKTNGLIQTQNEADEYNDNYNLSYITGIPWTPGDVKYIDLNGDKKIDKGANTLNDIGDLTIIGNSTPRYQYSINAALSWKGFALSVLFQGVGKRDWNPESDTYYFWGCGPNAQTVLFKEHLDYWSENNRDAYYPKPYINNGSSIKQYTNKNTQISDRYLQDASYCRLKNLTISYDLPNSLINRINIQKAQIFFSGDNLFTFTKLKGMFDPEAIFTQNSSNNKIQSGAGKNYPINRILSVGLILNL